MVSKRYQFGDYVVDPERNLVTSDQGEVQLEPKSMDVLVMLLERPGRVVSVDELLDTVWAGQVVEGATIYQRVSKLRQALGKTQGRRGISRTSRDAAIGRSHR